MKRNRYCCLSSKWPVCDRRGICAHRCPGRVTSEAVADARLGQHAYRQQGRTTELILDHAAEFADCMSTPDGDLGYAVCGVFDSDRDNDVDLADAASFQRAFTGP